MPKAVFAVVLGWRGSTEEAGIGMDNLSVIRGPFSSRIELCSAADGAAADENFRFEHVRRMFYCIYDARGYIGRLQESDTILLRDIVAHLGIH